jgi:hypothetical protein
MNTSESTKVVRNDALPTGEIDGELVALDLEKGDCFGLDRVGAAIWHIAESPRTVGEIADRLVETHDVERTRCLTDILPFVDEMIDTGLLRRLD